MLLVSIENLTKTYDANRVPVRALNGVSLAVDRGAFLALAGPSGSGKTTLLNLIGALDAPTAGRVVLDGRDLSTLIEKKLAAIRLSTIGFVFQSYNLIPVLTAAENVEYPLLLQGVAAAERHSRVAALLDAVGLAALARKRPAAMSGGQQQRVALARALVARPALVLADEPTANLDSETAAGLMALMQNINEQQGTTFILSTHDALVMNFARRLVRLKDGAIVT